MKKTIITLILLIVFAISGCSATNKTGSETPATTTGNSPNAKQLKVVLIIPGTLGDKSFFDAANKGLSQVKETLGAQTKVIEMGTDNTKWEPTFTDVAAQDWDIIISGGTVISEMFNATAVKNPNKKFINFDTDIKDTPANVYSLTYSTSEVSFLAGAVAALTTTSKMPNANPQKVIGFLGGLDIPGINAFLVGYIEGAQYVLPDVKVAISYAGDFANPGKGKELSLLQYNSGVDVIFNVAGGTGLGIFDAAKEKKKYAIGVDSDQAAMLSATDSQKADLIITSAIKKIDSSILNAVKKTQDGSLKYGTYNIMGVSDGGVDLADNAIYKAAFPDDLKAKILDIKKKLVNKEIKVDNAIGWETAAVDKIRNAVKP